MKGGSNVVIWIVFILSVVVWWFIWNVVKSIFFSNAIVSFSTYYGAMLCCYFLVFCGVGCVIECVIEWVIGLFSCLII